MSKHQNIETNSEVTRVFTFTPVPFDKLRVLDPAGSGDAPSQGRSVRPIR